MDATKQLVQTVPVSVLENLLAIVRSPQALPRRKEWVSGQQYSYVLLENVEAMIEEVCRTAMPAQPVIPLEPTAAMQAAGAAAIRFDTTPINKLFTANAVYRAMMAAALEVMTK